jgi:short-subunit dehydrogenase
MNTLKGKKIWIIGASSGIGAALTAELSKRGALLTISARREGSLETVASTLTPKPALAPLDVSNSGDLKFAFEKHGPFDSVIFLAAIYNPGLLEDMDLLQAKNMIDININGALNMIDTVYPQMRSAQKGQILLCGSVAAYAGLPNSQPYSLTKAAIMNLTQTLKTEAERYNVDVKLISPGFVKTPLTDKNNFQMPMIVEPECAAKIIADGLTSKAFEIHFPKKFTWIVKILSLLPYGAYFSISRKILKDKLTKSRKNA